MPDRLVSVPMTLSDPNPGFMVTVYLQVEYLKTARHFLPTRRSKRGTCYGNGWLAVSLSHAGIVSKQLNLS